MKTLQRIKTAIKKEAGFTVVEVLIILVIGFCLYKVLGAVFLALGIVG